VPSAYRLLHAFCCTTRRVRQAPTGSRQRIYRTTNAGIRTPHACTPTRHTNTTSSAPNTAAADQTFTTLNPPLTASGDDRRPQPHPSTNSRQSAPSTLRSSRAPQPHQNPHPTSPLPHRHPRPHPPKKASGTLAQQCNTGFGRATRTRNRLAAAHPNDCSLKRFDQSCDRDRRPC